MLRPADDRFSSNRVNLGWGDILRRVSANSREFIVNVATTLKIFSSWKLKSGTWDKIIIITVKKEVKNQLKTNVKMHTSCSYSCSIYLATFLMTMLIWCQWDEWKYKLGKKYVVYSKDSCQSAQRECPTTKKKHLFLIIYKWLRLV